MHAASSSVIAEVFAGRSHNAGRKREVVFGRFMSWLQLIGPTFDLVRRR